MKESTKKEKKKLVGWNVVIAISIFCLMASIGVLIFIKTLGKSYNVVFPFFLTGVILAILQGFLIKIY